MLEAETSLLSSQQKITPTIAKIAIDNIIFRTANSTLVEDTKTKITYSSDGLVINGEDATTADIQESDNRYYLTDEILDKINNPIYSSNFYHLTTRNLTNNLVVQHSLNGKVLVEAMDENDNRVVMSSKRVDDNSIMLLLEEDFIGYLYIYKLSTGFFQYNISFITDGMAISHNLNGIVLAKLFNSDDEEVYFNYKTVDTNNIVVYLEESMLGYLYIYKIN